MFNIWRRRKARKRRKLKRNLALERIRKGELVCLEGHLLDRKVRGVKELYKKGLAKKQNRVYCNKCQSNLGLTRHVYRCAKTCRFNLCRWCFKTAQQIKHKLAERKTEYLKNRRRTAYMRRVRAKTVRIGLRRARVIKKQMVLAKIVEMFKFRQAAELKRSNFVNKGGAGGSRPWMTVDLNQKSMTIELTSGSMNPDKKKKSLFGRNQILEEDEPSGTTGDSFSSSQGRKFGDLRVVIKGLAE